MEDKGSSLIGQILIISFFFAPLVMVCAVGDFALQFKVFVCVPPTGITHVAPILKYSNCFINEVQDNFEACIKGA